MCKCLACKVFNIKKEYPIWAKIHGLYCGCSRCKYFCILRKGVIDYNVCYDIKISDLSYDGWHELCKCPLCNKWSMECLEL